VFTVMLVPHTLANTTLGLLRKGSKVHIEVDMVARYIYRMQEFHKNER
jgi:riboflavin synthase